jgi:hypothetical protein
MDIDEISRITDICSIVVYSKISIGVRQAQSGGNKMLDNSGSMDARIATQMGMTDALRKDRTTQTNGNDYNDIRHGHTVVAAKGGLFNRFILNLLR